MVEIVFSKVGDGKRYKFCRSSSLNEGLVMDDTKAQIDISSYEDYRIFLSDFYLDQKKRKKGMSLKKAPFFFAGVHYLRAQLIIRSHLGLRKCSHTSMKRTKGKKKKETEKQRRKSRRKGGKLLLPRR